MASFPPFMKQRANRIAATSQNTPGIEGYIFDGVDGSQMAFWECQSDALTAEHVHAFDEYLVVIEGRCTLTINGENIHLHAGQEYFIPRGTRMSGSVAAGTRTIHVFGGTRAKRENARAPAVSD